MKRIALPFATAFIAFLLSSLRPETNVASIEMEIMDCRDSGKSNLSEVEIFKDGKKYLTVSPERYEPIILNSLSLGVYEFRYASIFSTLTSVTVDAKKPGHYSGVLNTTQFDCNAESYHPMIDRLHADEKYLIFCKSVGCFNHSEESLWIIRTDTNYIAEYDMMRFVLDSSKIERVRRFELELNHMHYGGCTNNDEYRIRYEGRTWKHIQDRSCKWGGLFYLLRDLGIPQRS